MVYRSPNQSSEEFNIFQESLQVIIGKIKDRKLHCIILTGDFNCRSRQWWPNDVDSQEGTALNEFVESNDLAQLIDQPANIEPRGISFVDLIITDQPNLFVGFGIHPSLDNCCHHQIIHGDVNLSVPSPPPYERKVWEYSKANINEIRTSLQKVDRESKFKNLTVVQMTKEFTIVVMKIIDRFIPNKMIKVHDKDPPWMTPEIKTAIKRKHRIYNKYVKRGRKPNEWEYVRLTRNETSKLFRDAKENYFACLGRKLSDPVGIKTYSITLNKTVNKKNTTNIPPLLENGLFVTNFQTKADIFNEFFVQQCSLNINDSTLSNPISRCSVYLKDIEIDPKKLLKIIRALDCNKAHGWDNLSISMIKICDAEVVKPLCLIFNQCLWCHN